MSIPMTTSKAVQGKINSLPRGAVFCANDVDDFGSRGNVDVILHRLAKQGAIRRLGYGLYDLPRNSPVLGNLSPDIKDVISAYSRRMGQIFVLDPLNSANALGLTTQVPSKLVYLTDGKSHVINICGVNIHLLHTCPKKLAGATVPAGIILQALRYFGPKGAPDTALRTLATRLTKNDVQALTDLKNKISRNMIPQIDRITTIATLY